jgi:hypothetical protein
MVIEIDLKDIEPFSINKAYYKKTFTRTQACREWAGRVIVQMETMPNHKRITSFREKFDPSKHYLSINLDFYMPYSKLFTKKGTISCISKDLTNVEKMLVDVLMDKRHFERGVNNLNINDALILSCQSNKIPFTSFKTVVTLQMNKLQPLKDKYEHTKQQKKPTKA